MSEQEIAPTEVTQEEPAKPQEEQEKTEDSLSIHELEPGQELQGTVKNATDFGAFIDLGIGQDGLVHISELSRRRVEKVTDVVNEGEEVIVWVKKVDKKRGRISLTMVPPVTRKLKDLEAESVLEGVVTRIEAYGAFVDIGTGREGLIHVSELSNDYINSPDEVVSVGDKVKVMVLKVNRKKKQVDLSIKALEAPKSEPEPEPEPAPMEEGETVTAMSLAFQSFMENNEQD